MDHSAYRERINTLADRARRDREAFELPENPPDDEQAMEYLRTGLGPTIALYIEARTKNGDPIRFTPVEMALLEQAMNDWLALYTRCYAVVLDTDFTIREAAELLVQTHNIKDAAQLLTHVPERNGGNSNNQ